MKDYSLNDEERKSFVLNYSKEEETITANFADGSSYTVPNTENNENKIEGKMIEQVVSSKGKEKKLVNSNTANILLICVVTIASIVGVLSIKNIPTIKAIAFAIGAATTLNMPMLIKLAKNNSILKDIQKNRYFVNNQEVINRGITNTNVLANSNTKEEIITINDIDYRYNYDELKQIVENTERQEQFNFDTFSKEEVSSKPKTKTRRR